MLATKVNNWKQQHFSRNFTSNKNYKIFHFSRKVWSRIFGIWIQAGWQAQICQQFQLQERYNDQKGGLCSWRCNGRAEKNHPGLGNNGRRWQFMAATRSCGSTRAGNFDWRRTHLIHHIKDGLVAWRKQFQRSRRTSFVLLSGAGSEMSGVLFDWIALQNQAHLILQWHKYKQIYRFIHS